MTEICSIESEKQQAPELRGSSSGACFIGWMEGREHGRMFVIFSRKW